MSSICFNPARMTPWAGMPHIGPCLVGDRFAEPVQATEGAAIMLVQEFAKKYRLRTTFDDCKEVIIPCKRGQIYECGGGKLAVLVEAVSARGWHSVRKSLLAAGFELRQNGDCEGTLSFDPADPKQAELAIKVMRARRKRQLSDAQKAELIRRLPIASKSRRPTAQEGAFAALESFGMAGVLPEHGPMQVQA
jgi:hypothetical protein